MPFDVKTNPLLDLSDLARFDAIAPGHITPAIDYLLDHCRATVAPDHDAATPADWATSSAARRRQSSASAAPGARCRT